MLRPRIIPCLLISGGGLVKTIQFSNPKYVGDPLNAVRIFNEKQVDELMVLDIDATAQQREPNYGLIRQLATECRMPLCYGGGISTPEQIEKSVSLGVEKVAICSSIIKNDSLITKASNRVGRQSIVAVLDIKKRGILGRLEVMSQNATIPSSIDPIQMAKRVVMQGAGEIVINNVDRDGVMKGYDLDLISKIRAAVTVPLSAMGGAGSLQDIGRLIQSIGICGAVAGSLFVFKGAYRAVLINYPRLAEKDELINSSMSAYQNILRTEKK